jgi:hypothetical protein
MSECNSNFADFQVIPVELIGSIPRKTRISSNGIRTAAGVAVLLAIGATVAVLAGMNALRETRAMAGLRRDGLQVLGEVTEKDRTWIKYTFAANGTIHTGDARGSQHNLEMLRRRGPIQIRYLSSNPDVNYPAGWEWSVVLDLDKFMAPLLPCGLGIAFLILILRDQTVVAKGTPTVGVVTKCTPTARGVGFDLRYEFRTSDGVEAEANGWYRERQEPGARICVLYLPQNLRRNQPYPSHYFRVAQ